MSAPFQVLREPRSSLRRGGAGTTCQQVPVIPPPPAPLHLPGLQPPSPPQGNLLPLLTRLPAAREHLPANGRGGERGRGGRERASAVPGADGASVPGREPKRKPPTRGAEVSVSGLQSAPLAGAARAPKAAGASRGGFRVPGALARPCPRWEVWSVCGRPRQPAPGAPHPALPPGSPARAPSHPPCRSRGRRRRPRGQGPAAGAVPAQRRCRPAAERPGSVPRPVPAREPPRQPSRRRRRRRCSAPSVAAAERPSCRLWRVAGRLHSLPL